MASGNPGGKEFWLKAIGLILGSISIDLAARADDLVPGPASAAPVGTAGEAGLHGRRVSAAGTLGYGPPGLYPGFQGFGLGYHLGYGYGGDALGVGAEGGYPLYGGPGYPHPWPGLNRLCGINPFPYFGGPGYPTPEQPHYFGGIGPLVPDRPVVIIAIDPRKPCSPSDYGPYTGAVPDAEVRFAPFTAQAAAGVSTMREVSPTIPAPMPPPAVPGNPAP